MHPQSSSTVLVVPGDKLNKRLFQKKVIQKNIEQNQLSYIYSQQIENNLLHKIERHLFKICYTVWSQPFQLNDKTGSLRILQEKYQWLTYYAISFFHLCLAVGLIENLRRDIDNKRISRSSHIYRVLMILLVLITFSFRSIVYFKRSEFLVFSNTIKKFYQDLQGKVSKYIFIYVYYELEIMAIHLPICVPMYIV